VEISEMFVLFCTE